MSTWSLSAQEEGITEPVDKGLVSLGAACPFKAAWVGLYKECSILLSVACMGEAREQCFVSAQPLTAQICLILPGLPGSHWEGKNTDKSLQGEKGNVGCEVCHQRVLCCDTRGHSPAVSVIHTWQHTRVVFSQAFIFHTTVAVACSVTTTLPGMGFALSCHKAKFETHYKIHIKDLSIFHLRHFASTCTFIMHNIFLL